MSIGEHRHCCVTFKSRTISWLRDMTGYSKCCPFTVHSVQRQKILIPLFLFTLRYIFSSRDNSLRLIPLIDPNLFWWICVRSKSIKKIRQLIAKSNDLQRPTYLTLQLMKQISSKQNVKSQPQIRLRIMTGVSGLKNWHRNKASSRRLSNDSVLKVHKPRSWF